MNRENSFTNKDNLNIQIIFNEVGLSNIITIKNGDEIYYIDATIIFQKLINLNPKMTWSKTKLVLYSFEFIEKQLNNKFDENIKSLIKSYGVKTNVYKRLHNILK